MEEVRAEFWLTQGAYDAALAGRFITQDQYDPWRTFFEDRYKPVMTEAKVVSEKAPSPDVVIDVIASLRVIANLRGLRREMGNLRNDLVEVLKKKGSRRLYPTDYIGALDAPIMLAQATPGGATLEYKPAPDTRWRPEEWATLLTAVGGVLAAVLVALGAFFVIITKAMGERDKARDEREERREVDRRKRDAVLTNLGVIAIEKQGAIEEQTKILHTTTNQMREQLEKAAREAARLAGREEIREEMEATGATTRRPEEDRERADAIKNLAIVTARLLKENAAFEASRVLSLAADIAETKRLAASLGVVEPDPSGTPAVP